MFSSFIKRFYFKLHWKVWSIYFLVGFFVTAANSQEALMSRKIYPFPDKYKTLSTDQLKMEFLVKIVSDSLNEDQLTPVYNWSVQGLLLAEKNKVDSMKGIFNYFIGKAFTYKYLKPDSAIYYYKKVLPYFPDKLRKYNVFSVREIMERYSEMGNKDSSFVYLDSLKALIDTMPEFDPKRVSLSQNIATVYQWFGMFKTAIAYYQLSVNGARKNGHLPGLGMALANLGELYNESEDDQKAIQTSKEALGYLENITMPYMKTASNLASYYNNLEIYDSAFIYLKKSDSIAKKVGDREQQITNSIIWADFFLIQKKYNQAKSLLAKILNELNGGNNTWGLAKAYLSAAALDTMLHSYTAAKNKLIKSLGISKKNKQEVLVVIALQNLAVVLFKLKDYKSAFHYQQEYLMRKDSLSNEKTKAALADLEISYQTKQKEEQIALLKKDNAIKKLELQNNRRTLIFYILAFLMALTIAVVIFYQRNLRTSIKVQKIKAELENKVLRLQMNPHFIFNSLNSIENFIMQNEKRLASDYLNKFARLIRMILDSSRNEVVPIAKDMEALQLYIDLEQLRFNNRFSYQTIIDPVLAGGDYRVPSLLIQPYVENAIVHGLAHSEEKGLMLTVMASLENEKIKYTVQDNGVGRAQASVYNQQNKPYHKSVGLKITEDRINLFNKHPDGNDFVHFTDLLDNEKNPAGTRVEIMLNTI